jgi:branched-chain amino acid transport system substrate-binding protein
MGTEKSQDELLSEYRKGTISRRDFMILSGIFGGATLLTGMGLFAPGPSYSSKDAIRIGNIFPLSGQMALLGDETCRGTILAMEEWNAKGGINGRPIEYVQADAPDPKAGVNETERLITNEKVNIMIGVFSSNISHPITAVCERNKCIYMEASAVADDILQRGFKYIFRTTSTCTMFGQDAVGHSINLAAKLGIPKDKLRLAIINEDTLYGSGVTESALKVAKQEKLNVVSQEAYNAKKAVDLSPVILRVREANPDIMIHTALVSDAILFQRQAKELNFYVKATMGVSAGYAITGFSDALGKLSDGVLSTDYTQWQTNPAFAAKLPAYIAAYEKKYGHKPRAGQSIAGFDAANALFMGLEGAKDLTSDSIRESLMKIDVPKYQTATGWGVKFDETGQNTRTELICFQWKNGQQCTVLPDKARLPGNEMEIPLKPWAQRG